VRFSIYSEMQLWDENPPKQLYGEVTEQVVNADRLGYAGGFDHWQAIKTQEIFAHEVMPHFRRHGEAGVEDEGVVMQQV
jgi:hypothetical protein